MNRRVIGAFVLMVLTVACGSPVQKAANKLIEQVRLGDPLAQQTYAQQKDLLESAEALPIWIEALQNGDSPQVKEWAAQILGNIGDPSALQALAGALSGPRNVRDAAVAAIKQFPEDQAAAAFVAALESGERDGQAVALAQLSRLRPEEAVEAVAAIAASDDELLSRTAIDTLGDIGGDAAAEALVALVIDPQIGVDSRRQALMNLGRVERAEAQIQEAIASLEAADDEASSDLLKAAKALR